MGNQSKTVHVVELNGNAQKLQDALKKLQGDFSNISSSPEINKIFDKLETSLNAILRKTSKGIIPREDFLASEKELKKVKSGMDSLHNTIEGFKKLSDKKLLSMVPDDTKAKLTEANNAFIAYNATVEKVIKAEEKLAEAQKKKEAAQLQATALENSRKGYAAAETRAKNELKKYADITNAINEQREASQALKKAEQELAEAKAGGKSEKVIANKEAKRSVAKERSDKANLAVAQFDAAQFTAHEAATNKVTNATEKLTQAKKEALNANKVLTAAQIAEDIAIKNLASAKNKSKEETLQEEQALARLRDALVAVNPEFKDMAIEGESTSQRMVFLKTKVSELSDLALKKLCKSLGVVEEDLEAVDIETQKTGDSFNETKEAIKESDQVIKDTQAFEDRIKSFLGLRGAATVLRKALRDAIDTISQLDATMTEMAVVTNLSVGDYWDQLPEYSKSASELGVAINDTYKAATLYYQQGLKSEEVTALYTETLKMAKIAGMNAADATDKMTAALRGFNMELNEESAKKVADVYSELAAVTAASTQEIANAMTKTASIASSAGMEFETTSAFLSQIIETTRESAETAGTAMKTIIARFQELKKAPKEIGEVDGEIVDANRIEGALRTVGVALRDASGQFRNLDDVFLDLASRWDTLDTNTQRYIATIAAGSRQQSRFIAMMSDYKRTQELVTAANSSAGASTKQFEKTQDSLASKIERLKNAWHEFTMGIMESDLVKFGVDILTKFFEIVNKATSAFNGLGGSIVKIASVLAIFKLGSKIFEKLRNPLVKFFADVVKLSAIEGEKSGQAFAEGARIGAQKAQTNGQSEKLPEGYKRDSQGRLHDKQGRFVSKEEEAKLLQKNTTKGQKVKAWATEKTGVSSIKSGWKTYFGKDSDAKKERNKLEEMKEMGGTAHQRQQKLDTAKKTYENMVTTYGEDSAEAKKYAEEVKKAEQAVTQLDEQQKKAAAAGAEGWTELGQGLGQMGQAATTVGMGMSAFGGILQSMGLEAFGEGISKAGNAVTIFGSALMTLPAIFSVIQAVSVATGVTISTALWMVTLIVAAIAIVAGVIAVIVASINKNSPEAKLKKAEEASEKAAEAADKAKESYENLANALDELDGKYNALDELTRGTKEWNEAVRDINSSVLSLIEEYPELAKFVENKEGVLTIDMESEQVQDVLASYDKKAIIASSVSLGMKAEVNDAKVDVAEDRISDSWKGSYIGDDLATSLGEALASGVITENGAGGLSIVEGSEGLAESMGITEDILDTYRKQIKDNVDVLREYGSTVSTLDSQTGAVYDAMATTASELVDMGSWSDEAKNAASNLVNGEDVARYQAELEEQYKDDDSAETEAALEKYMLSLDGVSSVKKIKDNKIVYYDENGEKQKVDKEVYIKQMIAAQATEKAAEAMEKIPEAMDNVLRELGDAEAKAFEKIMTSGSGSLTQSNITDLKAAGIVATKNEDGEYTKEDNAALYDMWDNLSAEEQAIWGDFNDFAGEYAKNLENAEKSFADAAADMKDMGIEGSSDELFGKMTASAAKAWANNLESIAIGGADVGSLQGELNNLTAGLSEEDLNIVMSEINSLDMSDMSAWEGLVDTFDELNIAIPQDALDSFITKAIDVSGAIRKIDFENLHNQINDTYKLLNQVKQGGRTFSEDQYKDFIANNKDLADSFIQVGDDFIFMGGTMEELTSALEENTIAILSEANRQLEQKIGMANIVAGDFWTGGDVGDMDDKFEFQNYLANMSAEFSKNGYDIADLGITGLTQSTNFEEVGLDQLQEWAEEIEALGGQIPLLEDDYSKNLRNANIQRYSHNDAAYNAQMALSAGGEYSDEHQEALILQAIQSGAVSNATIQAYREAIVAEDEILIESLGEQMANEIDRVIENSVGRDAYVDLVDRITEALETERQKEIDKLTEVNESINNAQSILVSKIQEQIDDVRQARANEEAKQNLRDLASQSAYLAMDTSGANQLSLMQNNEELKQAEQDYEDSLVDQALQNIQDTNEQAAQQRETQIALLQAQLDADLASGAIATEAAQIVQESLQEVANGTDVTLTEMGDLLANNETNGMNEFAKEQWGSDLQTSLTSAINWLEGEKVPTVNVTDEADLDDEGASDGVTDAQKVQQQKAAIATAAGLGNNRRGGLDTSSSEYQQAWADYQAAGGTDEAAFKKAVGEKITGGSVDGVSVSGLNSKGAFAGDYDKITAEIDGAKYTLQVKHKKNGGGDAADSSTSSILSDMVGGSPGDGWIAMYNSKPYIYVGGNRDAWYEIANDDDYSGFKTKYLDKLRGYKKGGLADFTGPAWLDGTPSKPEYILNATQTERFFSLIDILEEYNKNGRTEDIGGDNYFDININVDSLSSDYDVEQMANKIRKMLYEDATYRNVNAINHKR